MRKKIPFDKKYLAEIKSGKYQVIDQFGTVLKYEGFGEGLVDKVDKFIVQYPGNNYTERYYDHPENHLFLLTDEEEDFTPFEEYVGNMMHNSVYVTTDPSPYAIRYRAAQLMEQAKLQIAADETTKNKEAAEKFLKSAGIMDENGDLAETYKTLEEAKPSAFEVAVLQLVNKYAMEPLSLNDIRDTVTILETLAQRPVDPDMTLYLAKQYDRGKYDALEGVKKNWHNYFKPQDVTDIYNEGIKKGKEEALEGLPRWRPTKAIDGLRRYSDGWALDFAGHTILVEELLAKLPHENH